NKDILITAIHGGGIEPGTSELAKIISKKGNFNLYSFEGLLKSNNAKLHITSTNFDDPKLKDMIYKSNESISIHGIRDEKKVVYIGGKDKDMSQSIQKELEKEGFNVEQSPNYVNGDSNNNIINKNDTGSGVQLEISTKYRKSFFDNGDFNRKTRENTNNYRQSIYDFAEAVTKGIKQQTN
ncbi:poly-gamma-glutamate hydrolase family protein, partial [Staphylococcus xylosus]